MLIRPERSRLKEVSGPFARAFLNYPLFVCYHPSQEWRERHFAQYCQMGLRYAFRNGDVRTTPDLKGTIIWFPPGKTHIHSLGYLEDPLFWYQAMLMGWKTLSRISTCEACAARVHQEIVPGPHWYLWALAVDPDSQGKGVGNDLLAPGLERADQQGLPVYLETHDFDNIAYYQRHGFEQIRSEQVPGLDLPFWCLLRPPAGKAP
ncbi:MAG: GNAT family N-acetyltransferase [Deltaproteobacteria bacterium]|nr:GNAT family N-acetyltransferase [Deltaproteobacteria bacterium]